MTKGYGFERDRFVVFAGAHSHPCAPRTNSQQLASKMMRTSAEVAPRRTQTWYRTSMPQRFSCSEQKRPGLLEKRVRRGELVTPRHSKRGLGSTREQLVVGRYDRLQTKTKIVVLAKECKQLQCIELPVLGTGLPRISAAAPSCRMAVANSERSMTSVSL